MDPVDVDQALDRALRELPAPAAPPTLLPRVLAAVSAADTRAVPTGWFTWPRSWQAASVAAVCVLAILTWMLVTAPPAGVSSATRTAGEAATVVRAFWQVLFQPVATYMFILGLSLALACAAAWAAMEVALGGVSRR